MQNSSDGFLYKLGTILNQCTLNKNVLVIILKDKLNKKVMVIILKDKLNKKVLVIILKDNFFSTFGHI
jgi:hypothetical protein